MRAFAKLYGERKADMASLISEEMGAPITFAKRAQVALPLFLMTAFSDLAAAYPWQETRAGAYLSLIHI